MFKLIEFSVIVILLVLVVGQVIVPGIKNRPLFPYFRKQRGLENTLVVLNQLKAEKKLSDEIKRENKHV